MSRPDKTTNWSGRLELDVSYVLQNGGVDPLQQKDGIVGSPFVLTIQPIEARTSNSYSVHIAVPPYHATPIPPVETIAQAFTSYSGNKFLLVKSLHAEMEITAIDISSDHNVLRVNFIGSGQYPENKITGIVYGKGKYLRT